MLHLNAKETKEACVTIATPYLIWHKLPGHLLSKLIANMALEQVLTLVQDARTHTHLYLEAGISVT